MEHYLGNYTICAKMTGVIYWIDEKEETLPSGAVRDQIEARCEAKIVEVVAKQGTLDHFEEKRVQGAEREMVVLDYWLNNLPNEKDEKAETKTEFGSNWAVVIRSHHANLPIVGVTSERIEAIPDSQRSQFLTLFNRDAVWKGEHGGDLQALMDGYHAVYRIWEAVKKKAVDRTGLPEKQRVDLLSLVALLQSPEETIPYLLSVLPEFAKQPWDQETPHEISRWIIDVLLGRPGFLMDPLEVATFLGLNELGFMGIAHYFEGAKYKGVYSSTDRPRWWADRLRPAFAEIVGRPADGPLREDREALLLATLGTADEDCFSRCHSGNASIIPECVAYADDERVMSERIQAGLGDTVPDPLESPPIGFEPRRLWKPQVID